MKRINKKFIIFILILFISIGFAYLSATLNIAGLIGYKGNTWNVYFDNVQMIKNDVSADKPIINNSKDSVDFNITFSEPSEIYKFSVDVVNDGTIDAMIGEFIKTGIDSTNEDYIDYSVKYSNGEEVNVNDLLAHNRKVRLIVNVEYKYTTDRLAPENTGNYSLTLKYVQANENARKVEELIESGNSNTFVLNNAKANTLSNIKIYGNSAQQHYTGRNLYNVDDYCTYKSNCVTNGSSADSDGWITLSYDNTEGSAVRYSNYFVNNLDLVIGNTYTVIMEVKSLTGTGSIYPNSTYETYGQLTSSHSYPFDSLQAGDVVSYTVTARECDGSGTRSFGRFAPGQSGSITIRLSVIEGSSVTAENFVYEPYVGGMPSPNPNYPQEVKNVSLDNSLLISSVNNIFDKNTIKRNYELAGYGGVEKVRDGWFVSDYMSIQPETNYQIVGKSGQYNCFYESNKTLINCEQLASGTITSPENAYYMRINDSLSNLDRILIFESDNFNPSSDNIYSSNNALLNYELISGSASPQTDWFVSDYLEIDESSVYYISDKTRGQQNAFYDSNHNYISTSSKVTGFINTPAGAKYLKINGLISEMEDIKIVRVVSTKKLELGSLKLYGIDDYKDYIYNKDGEWYVQREIFKHTFTNFIALTSIDNNQRWCKSFTNLGIPKMKYNIYYSGDNITNSYSTHFLISKQYSCNLSNDNLFAFSEWSDDSYIYFSRNIGSTGTEAGNAILGSSIYYPLYEPYDEKITDTTLINQLDSLITNNLFEGTNYVTVIGSDLAPTIEFDYEK